MCLVRHLLFSALAFLTQSPEANSESNPPISNTVNLCPSSGGLPDTGSLVKPVSACICAQSLQSCSTLRTHGLYSPPGSSVHGILQARILEWVAKPSSRGHSRPRDQTQGSPVAPTAQADSLLTEPPRKPQSSLSKFKSYFLSRQNQPLHSQTGLRKKSVIDSLLSRECHCFSHLAFIVFIAPSNMEQERSMWQRLGPKDLAGSSLHSQPICSGGSQ